MKVDYNIEASRSSARNAGFDLLRILAIFTVVIIHSSSGHIECRDVILRYLPPANACFAFLAGWFLFPTLLKFEEYGALAWKRIKRLAVPYAVWECIYVIINIAFDFVTGREQNIAGMDWRGIVFFGDGSVQLWFVATLIYVQTALLVVAAAVSVLCGRLKLRHAGVFFLCFMLMSFTALAWRGMGIESNHWRRFAFLFGYGAVGAGLCFVVKILAAQRWALLLGFAVGTIGIIVSFVRGIPEVVIVFSWCLTFGCMPVSAKIATFAAKCSSLVMSVYLCHVMFTRTIDLALPCFSQLIGNGYLLVLINASVAFFCSLFFAWIAKKMLFWGSLNTHQDEDNTLSRSNSNGHNP